VTTVKSAELSFVSWPSGSRTSLEPGAAVTGGAGANVPSTSPFAAVEPQPTESTSAPSEFRMPTPPAVDARPVEKDWSAAGGPA
jgi:hypothetical protein